MYENIKDIPSILYKYREFEGENVPYNYGAKTLLDFELFASSRSNFNDPFDLAMPYKLSNESLKIDVFVDYYVELMLKQHKGLERSPEIIYEITERYNNLISDPEKHWELMQKPIEEMDNKFYGILCFCLDYATTLMWSHYTDNHKGICLGFDGKLLFQFLASECHKKQIGLQFGPVDYCNDYPEYNIKDDYFKKSIVRGFTKHEGWGYEKEYRFLFINGTDTLFKYPPELIKEIYIGCKMEDKYLQYILNFIKKKQLKVDIYKMKQSYYNFGLQPVLIYRGQDTLI